MPRALDVAFAHCLQRRLHEQVALLRRVDQAVVEQSVRPLRPARCARSIAAAEQAEGDPHGAACGIDGVALGEEALGERLEATIDRTVEHILSLQPWYTIGE